MTGRARANLPRHGRSVARLLLAVFVTSALSDCSYPSPPRQWGKVVSAENGCSALVGRYVERGQIDARYSDHGPLWLSQALGIAAFNPETIEISYGADGALRARAMHGTDVIGEIVFRQNDATLSCDRWGAEIRSRTSGQTGVFIGVTTESTRLEKSEDGALLVRLSTDGAGIAFLAMPVAAGVARWTRFASVP
jgi:hypothetical protein